MRISVDQDEIKAAVLSYLLEEYGLDMAGAAVTFRLSDGAILEGMFSAEVGGEKEDA